MLSNTININTTKIQLQIRLNYNCKNPGFRHSIGIFQFNNRILNGWTLWYFHLVYNTQKLHQKYQKKGKLHLSISIIINCCPNGAPMLEALQRVSVNQHINGRPFNYWHTPPLLQMNHYQPNITISLPKSFHLFCLVNFVQKNLHFPFQSKICLHPN